ncbi:MAG: MATE family efflux transporter [Clostridia bacterium]|nr:MATE family efflux transporter [Clostridia bacterium]
MQANDFSTGSVRRHIIAQAVPLMMAQLVQLLYNIVDRIYIGHLPETGSMALTGLGITFPVIVLIAAFTSLFGTGGTPLFSIARGKKDTQEAEAILGNVFTLLVGASVILFAVCYVLHRPILFLFGASEASYVYADQYLQIYLLGTVFSMITTGLNGFINAQGFPKFGMVTTLLGAVINIVLDPLFIFIFNMGVQGAALATVISQGISALWVMKFLTGKKAIIRLKRQYLRIDPARTRRICSLGTSGFVMQGTNCLVQIVCNNQLQAFGGDLYVGIMTVLNSVREILSLPMSGISSGGQPVMGYNYGAGRNDRVKECIRFTAVLGFVYTLVAWILVMLLPRQLMGIFASDAATIDHGVEAMFIYFFGFVFMTFQFVGQNTYLALGRSKQAIFFSLLRKAFIVVPLTLLLPHMGFGVNGVFLAEPISNAVGGLAAFVTMWFTVYRKL